MKRILLLALIGTLGLNYSLAQFSLGVSGGLNVSNVKLDLEARGTIGSVEAKGVQYHFFGITPKYNISSKFSVSTDIQYSLKGYEQITNNPIIANERKHQFVYLDFLPKAEYQILQFLEIGLGCNIGILNGKRVKPENGNWEDLGTVDHPNDFGLVGSVRTSFRNFFFSVSYNHGLAEMTEAVVFTDVNGEPTGFADVIIYNRNLQVGIGYYFQFKKE